MPSPSPGRPSPVYRPLAFGVLFRSMTPSVTRRLRVSFVALLLANGPALGVAAQGANTIVIVVRHAEKAAAPANDPPLTNAGVARAKALAAALADANVQAIISTPTVRTRETARPTAEARRLPVETIRLGTVAEQAKAVAEAVRKHAGKTILVVGHSNTVGAIIGALGGPRVPDLCDTQYANLFTVILDGRTATLVRSTYGAPSPDPGEGCLNQMP